MRTPPLWLQRLMDLPPSLIGVLIAAVGGGQVLYIYAWTSMVPPGLTGTAYWHEILRKMFLSSAVVPTFFGLAMFLVGMVAVVMASVDSLTAGGLPMRIARAALAIGLAAGLVDAGVMLVWG